MISRLFLSADGADSGAEPYPARGNLSRSWGADRTGHSELVTASGMEHTWFAPEGGHIPSDAETYSMHFFEGYIQHTNLLVSIIQHSHLLAL